MISKIKFILKSIHHRYKVLRFRRSVAKRGGSIGNPLCLLNPQYIDCGKGVRIKDGLRIECYDKFYSQCLNPSFEIKDGVIIGHRFTGFIADKVIIGKDTIFAGNVTLISENHGIDPESPMPYHAQPLSHGPIAIGEGCWLGQNVSVLPNVRIGNKCIIGSNSVVTSDIPDFSIAVGSPARVIKTFDFVNHCWVKNEL